uniref:Lipoyl-binding domain-containing protein n=1 Tax=Caenorhabditis tropicalis TaxID=1561998 RepID=A0A1I7TFJ6_9PELO
MIGRRAVSVHRFLSRAAKQSISAASTVQPSLHTKSNLLEPLVQNVRITSTANFHMSAIRLNDVITVDGPAFAESISEGDIRWLKQKGDHVNEDELVAEIETDKTSVEVPAPQAGTIVELLVEDGAKVTAKQKLYKLQPGAGGGSAPAKKESKPAAAASHQQPVLHLPQLHHLPHQLRLHQNLLLEKFQSLHLQLLVHHLLHHLQLQLVQFQSLASLFQKVLIHLTQSQEHVMRSV